MTPSARFIGAAAIALLLLVGAACGKKEPVTTTEDTTDVIVENVNDGTDTDSVTDVQTNTNLPSTNSTDNTNASPPTNANVNVSVNNGSIRLTAPRSGEELASPFTVSGTAEGSTVYVKVKNSIGDTMFTEPVSVKNGAFTVNLSFEVSNSTSGSIEVYDNDAAGNAQNLVVVPVKFTAASVNANTNANVNESVNDNANGNTNVNANLNGNTNAYY